MNIEAIKLYVLNYFNHFTMYDYVAFAWLILTFFIALLLAIILAKRSVLLSVFTLLFALSIALGGPFILKIILDNFLRPSEAKITLSKKLQFTNAYIINGEVHNLSKRDFSICYIKAKLHKRSTNEVNKIIYKLKPLRKKTMLLEEVIKPGDYEEFKLILYNFDYMDDVNASIKSECY